MYAKEGLLHNYVQVNYFSSNDRTYDIENTYLLGQI